LSVNGYHAEICQKTGAPPTCTWVSQGGVTYLTASTESYGFGIVTTAPPNTQATIAQAPPCLTSASPPQPIANTACILFNSRGIPVDSTGAPYAANALYMNDGVVAYGVTVSATSTIRLWRTSLLATPSWTQQ
jgi:hypothetical protein